MAERSRADGPWWGEWNVAQGETRRWRVGPLTLWVSHLRGEWRIGHTAGTDPLDSSLEVAASAEAAELGAADTTERFVVGGAGDTVTLTPATADRAVVTRPQSSFHVGAGDAVTVFISSPLWVVVKVSNDARVLRELPSHRPSDTWLGPSTTTGELCYAMRTAARINLEDVPFRPHRAVTRATLTNAAPSPLSLERLSVPVPQLALFAGEDGRLWTPAISLRRSEDEEGLAELEIDAAAPAQAGSARRVGEPRTVTSPNGLVRAFSVLFSG